MRNIILIFCLVPFITMSCLSGGGEADGGSDTEKLCALTFDDGPDVTLSPLVLDKLEEHEVPATFFVIGQLINDDTAAVMERGISLGCEYENHSRGWSSMDSMTAEEIEQSIGDTTDAIIRVTGREPEFFRPPNLATSKVMYDTIDYPFASGVLGFDWAGCGTDAKDRADRVMENMEDGAIILLHDVQPQPHPTPEALDILIPKLKRQGYEFVTLSELFERKGIDPESMEYEMWVIVK
jgi:peptidoglycan/xylan/chitin deacetylase (PgdA/CDA1 family)